MGAVQAERFGGGDAVPLSVGECTDDQLAPVGIDGVMERRLIQGADRLCADHTGGEVMQR